MEFIKITISILEGLAEDYGISFVDEVVQKVCEKVLHKW